MTHDLFAPAKDAGLLQVELAALASVSRVTAGKWLNGQGMPHALHADKITALMDRVQALLDKGDLPVSPRLKGRDRLDRILSLVQGDVS